ncbi:MAG: aminopeptidase [Flavobacteriaceae bacterium]|nr:MAG: aminopeptidase [Flavobacteriaceae bacterium]
MRFLVLLFLLCLSGLSFAQHQGHVDFTKAKVRIMVNPFEKEVMGSVDYSFIVKNKTDSVFLDAKNMQLSSVELNGKKVKFINNQKTLSIYKKLKAGETYELSIDFKAKPKQTVYFVDWDSITMKLRTGISHHQMGRGVAEKSDAQVWTQGQGKYTSHWLPSLDDMTEKIEFDISIVVDNNYKVIANGKLKENVSYGVVDEWVYDMKQPMSSYLLAFVIGNFNKVDIVSTSGIPIELYYSPKDSLKVEPTYRYTKQIFDFMESEIGVPYPWQNYKQVPVRDFLYAGMENTSTTIFSDSYVIDSIGFVDKNFVNVNAHELAHQWFGDMVTEEDSKHHWLHEGFATYYAYLAEKAIFGDDHYYWKLYESAIQLDALTRKGNGEALTNPKASSLTFYEKGAWALHMLKEEVGDKAFKSGVKNYLLKHQFKSVRIKDFIIEIEQASDADLSDFKMIWLNGTDFPFEKAKENLKTSNRALSDFFELQWELTTSSTDNETIIKKYWNRTTATKFKEAVVATYYKSLSVAFIKEILNENDLKVRQAFTVASEKIPPELQVDFESLLEDESYITIESVLYKLWVHFPENRVANLEQTKHVLGLPNKNVRLLWLTLATLTKGYEEDKKQEYLKELQHYTNPEYNFEIRQTTFQYLNDIFGLTDDNLKDLANASLHHSWQFKKFARNLLDKLMEDNNYKKRISLLLKSLNTEEQRYINNKLNLE